jgi:hypothetical protein
MKRSLLVFLLFSIYSVTFAEKLSCRQKVDLAGIAKDLACNSNDSIIELYNDGNIDTENNLISPGALIKTRCDNNCGLKVFSDHN